MTTQHCFENELVSLHYYKFGQGINNMLCFHGYGMHGKQFKILEGTALACKYTFYGFDLFFHKDTVLKDKSIETIKRGISKRLLAKLIIDFCSHEQIEDFSVIGYSMGTHYATAIVEELACRIKEYVVVAPACLNAGTLVTFFSQNKIGNKILEKLVLSKTALINLLKLSKQLRFLDNTGYNILYKEIGTPQLRLNLYACFTYLRFLVTDESKLARALEDHHIKSIFIFGKRDKMYPPQIGDAFISKLSNPVVIVLDATHEMINQDFVTALSAALL